MKRNKLAFQKQDINQESKGFISDLKDKDKPMLGVTKLGKSSLKEKSNPSRPNGSSRHERGSNH